MNISHSAANSRVKQLSCFLLSCVLLFSGEVKAATPTFLPCKDSASFNSLANRRLASYEKTLSNYEPGTPTYLATLERMRSAKNRFSRQSALVCGRNDGLPRLFSSDPSTLYNSFAIPALQFLYIAVCIGWAGREYLLRTRQYQSEILINLPLALTLMATSPFKAIPSSWDNLLKGRLLQP